MIRSRGTRIGRPCLIAACLALALAAPSRAQTVGPEYEGLQVSRSALDSLRAQFGSVAASPAYSERLRNQAQASADQIQERLDHGDFRTGDRIILRFTADETRSDTIVVEAGRVITLEGMGRISLDGVLRSELEPHLSREIGRFVHNPDVRAQALVRLSIQGSVGRPGFYVMPATALLDDVIMQAGGPGQNADLDRIEIERGGTILIEGEAVREALTAGRSLDQLNILAGDQLTVPEKGRSNIWMKIGRNAAIVLSTILLGYRLF